MSYYVTHDNSFLDIKNAHLRVAGNVHADTVRVGAVEFNPGAHYYITGSITYTYISW